MSALALNLLAVSGTPAIVGHRLATTWQWYVIRAAGFASAGLVVLLMLSGIFQVTGLTYRFIEPVKAWVIHKALGIALVVAIIIHVSFLLIDKFANFSLMRELIPFASNYNNQTTILGISLGSFAVAFGIFAAYGILLIVATSLGWIDSKKRLWHLTHFVSYAVFALVVLHGLFVGTDLRYGTFRTAWIMLGAIVAIALLSRLRRAGTMSKGD